MLKKLLHKNEKATTAKIAVWYAFSSIFVRGIAFLSTPVFTRLLSKTDYGYFSNFTSWESILVIITTLDYTASIARAKYDFGEKMDTYLSSILLVSNLATLAAYALVELNRAFFETLFAMDIIYIRAMFLYVLFMPAFSYLQAKHRIYRKYRFFVLFAVFSALLQTGTAVLLVLWMQNKLLGRVIGYVLPTTILNICLEFYILLKGRKLDWSCVKYASVISVPLIPHAISGIILGNSDRIMITQYVGAEANALYTLAYQTSLLANMIWTSMNQAWAPWLYDSIHENKKAAIRNRSKLYLGVFSVLVIGVLLITPELMLILGDKDYYEARFVMPPVIMGCVFQFIYGMYVNLEIYDKKTFMISAGTMCAALLNVGLNALFIPKYGYIAAAYTTLLGYAALFCFHFIIVHTKVKYLSDIYSKKFIFGIIFLMFFFSGFSLVLYQAPLARYILLGIYVLLMSFFIIKYRNKIMLLLGVRKRKRSAS